MFDFFKDVALEARGIDPDELRLKKKLEKEEKKKETIIFSKTAKGIVYFFGIFYLLTGAIGFGGTMGDEGFTLIAVKFFFLLLVDLAALICISIKSKKTEIAGLILIAIFCAVMYSTTYALGV